MKALAAILIVGGVVGLLTWQVVIFISPDAVAMAIGFLFGVLAGVPATLLATVTPSNLEEDTMERLPASSTNPAPAPQIATAAPWQYVPVREDEPRDPWE